MSRDLRVDIYQELLIYTDDDRIGEIAGRIGGGVYAGWARDVETEDRLRKVSASPTQKYCFISPEAGGKPSAWLFLAKKTEGTWEVSNIVPRDWVVDYLTIREFNAILNDFYNFHLRPVTREMGIKTELTADHIDLGDSLTPAAKEKLFRFSSIAKKQAYPAQDGDKKRWDDFVSTALREGSTLNYLLLGRWLSESEGWPDEVADRLAAEFESAVFAGH